MLSKDEKRSEDDKSSTPVPGENLRAFYERTRDWWTHKAYENSSSKGKALRRDGCVAPYISVLHRLTCRIQIRFG